MSRSRRVAVLACFGGLVGVGAGLVAGGAAGAHSADGRARGSSRPATLQYSVDIQAVFSAAGNPLLVANFSPNGSLAQAHWTICAPTPPHSCLPARTHHHALSPGPRPAGTVFRATAHYLGRSYSAEVRWLGRVTAHSRPRLRGGLTAGARVNPVAAIWSGGWGGEFDQLGVEACRTKSARRCITVSGGQLGCPDHSHAAITTSLTGWYLFALDARSPADEDCAGVAWGSESAIPVWPKGRTVARSAAYGPVAGG